MNLFYSVLQIIIVAISVTCPHKGVFAAQISFGAIDPRKPGGATAIIVRGEIRSGDYDTLLSLAKEDPQRFLNNTIVLASEGGDLLEAIKIGRFIQRTYMSVLVNPAIGRCASACFFIYVAAVDRMVAGTGLGIHRPYFRRSDIEGLSLSDVEARERLLSAQVRKYLEDLEVPRYIIDRMFSLASTEMHWLTDDDIGAIGIRSNWWDQLLVTRCGLDKEVETAYLRGSTSRSVTEAALRQFKTVTACAVNISADEQAKNFRSFIDGH